MGLLNILYQDGDLVAVNKPDGLLVHRSRQSRDHVVAMQLVRDQLIEPIRKPTGTMMA
jgi:tRNA pseudouridine65 synthase